MIYLPSRCGYTHVINAIIETYLLFDLSKPLHVTDLNFRFLCVYMFPFEYQYKNNYEIDFKKKLKEEYVNKKLQTLIYLFIYIMLTIYHNI